MGQDAGASLLARLSVLTATTLADAMVAHAPCQVLVAKDVYNPLRRAIADEHQQAHRHGAPPPPRRAHTQDTSPVAPQQAEEPLEQLSSQVSKLTESVTSFFEDMFGEPKTPPRPAEGDEAGPSSSSSSTSSTTSNHGSDPADAAADGPRTSLKDRLSLDSIKKFGTQLPFFSSKSNNQ